MKLAGRMAYFDSSGIRKVFDLASKMRNPINLSIGQPDFEVPDAIKRSAVEAIHRVRYVANQRCQGRTRRFASINRID